MRIRNIFCLIGPSGAGKTTILRELTKEGAVRDLEEVVSTTTRQPRAGEEDGVDYHFITAEQAQAFVEDGFFIEHVVYHGNTYGFLRKDFEGVLEAGNDVVCVVELNGFLHLNDVYDNVVGIYVTPGYNQDRFVDVLAERMAGSGRTDEEIQKRLSTVEDEVDAAKDYMFNEIGFVVANHKLPEAVDDVRSIIAGIRGINLGIPYCRVRLPRDTAVKNKEDAIRRGTRDKE